MGNKPIQIAIVVAGDMTIKETDANDFNFDGVVFVLDDLIITDRTSEGANNVKIKGAVLGDNTTMVDEGLYSKKGQKRRKRKAKQAINKEETSIMRINNASVVYDADTIAAVSSFSSARWSVVPGSWQEF